MISVIRSPGIKVADAPIGYTIGVRIAIVAESFLPQVNGVVTSVTHIVDELSRRGHETLVVAPAPGDERYRSAEVVRVGSIGLPGYPEVRIGAARNRIFGALRDFRPDLVHLASPVVLGASALAACRHLDLPSVAVFQTDLARFAAAYRLGWSRPMVWAWLRRIHNAAGLTLAPTRRLRAELRLRGFERVGVWGRGVDTERFHPRERCEGLRSRLAPSGERLIGSVGRLAPEKELHLLSHVARVPGSRLVVVGDGPQALRLQRLLPDAVFTGRLEGPRLARAYASFDLLVHTGRSETFGQVIQEALSSGVPVVAPGRGVAGEVVRSGVNGWLWPARRPERIHDIVAMLFAEPDLLGRLGSESRPSVLHRSWPRLVDDLVGHYAGVVDTPIPVAA